MLYIHVTNFKVSLKHATYLVVRYRKFHQVLQMQIIWQKWLKRTKRMKKDYSRFLDALLIRNADSELKNATNDLINKCQGGFRVAKSKTFIIDCSMVYRHFLFNVNIHSSVFAFINFNITYTHYTPI